MRPRSVLPRVVTPLLAVALAAAALTGTPAGAVGGAADDDGESRLERAARVNEMTVPELRRTLGDPTAKLFESGRLYYAEKPVTATEPTTAAAAPFPLDQTFALHSKPGSARTIYLDFNGQSVVDTIWNELGDLPNGAHPAWDPAGDGAAFNTAEREAVQDIWLRVAEDYAPFDVDVTTQDPGPAALERSSAADTVYGARALVSPSDEAAEVLCEFSCGGLAILDVFDEFAEAPSSYFAPAWIFPQLVGPDDPKGIAETISHEVGHNLALDHHGQDLSGTGDPDDPDYFEYYSGHPPWAPIMGDGYFEPLTHWSAGDYADATRPNQDDLALITSEGLDYRTDEAGDTVATAGPLPAPGDPAFIADDGGDDVDVLSLGTCTGEVTAAAYPAPVSPNLDLEIQLLDATGMAVATADPPSEGVNFDVVAGLDAELSTPVTAGAHYLRVDGVGNGNPVTGYDDYGSLGQYRVDVDGCATVAGVPSAPQNVDAVRSGRDATLTWTAPADPGSSAITGYQIRIDGGAPQTVPATQTTFAVTDLFPGSETTFTVRAVNAAGTGAAGQDTVTLPSTASAPTGVAATRNGTADTLRMTWSPPADNGGTPVLGYEVAIDDSPWIDAQAAGAHTFSGVPDSAHTVFVRAITDIGPGSAAFLGVPAVVVVRVTPPGPPRIARASSGRKRGAKTATARWLPPLASGNTPVLGYQVFAYQLASSGRTKRTIVSRPLGPGARSSVVRLPKGRYAFAVRARNVKGYGPLSQRSRVVRAR